MRSVLSLFAAFLAMIAIIPAPAQQPTSPAAGAAPSRGQSLYDTFCVQCHMSQIHWRVANSARDWPTLRAQVDRWQAQSGQNWSDQDIDAVARYLNDTIYHYRVPEKRG